MLKRFGYLLTAILLISFSFSSVPAQDDSPGIAGKPLDFYGNNFSDWVTISVGTDGGNFIWNILRNDNPSPPGPGQATIARPPWGVNQIGSLNETGDFIPAFGDYTGDGRNDLAVYRQNAYWIQPSPSGATFTIRWGTSTEFNWLGNILAGGVEGDYDGDGRMDATIVRNSSGVAQWWILRSSNMTLSVVNLGIYSSDFFLPGADYDADGRDDPAMFRVAGNGQVTWYVANTSGVLLRQVNWGNYNTDFVIPAGDYDGDRRADFMVWRSFGVGTNSIWYLLTNTGNVQHFYWGIPGINEQRDVPLRSGDYDGDNRTDVAVWRPSTQTFWVRRSSTGQPMTQHWQGDMPLARFGIF
jgi:hypothetical protein